MPPKSPSVVQLPAPVANMSYPTLSSRTSSVNRGKSKQCRFIVSPRATKGGITKSASIQGSTLMVNSRSLSLLKLLLNKNTSHQSVSKASTTVFVTRYNKLWAVSKAGAFIAVTYLGNYQDTTKIVWYTLSFFPPIRSTDSSIVRRLNRHLLKEQALAIVVFEAPALVFSVVRNASLLHRAALSSELSLSRRRDRNNRIQTRASRFLPGTHEDIVLVLDNGEAIEIDRALLVHTSEYFGSIFGSRVTWLESNTGVIHLEGIKSADMGVYLHWLDTGNIEDTVDLLPAMGNLQVFHLPATQTHELVLVGNKSTVSVTEVPIRIRSLLSAYLLGDYLGTPSFQNDIMDAFLSEYSNFYDLDSQIPLYNIPIITSTSGRRSAIQKLVADTVYAFFSPETMNKAIDLGTLNVEVTGAVAGIGMGNEAVRRLGRDMPWDRLKCRYHVHPAGPLNGMCEDMWSLEREFEEYLNPPGQSAWTNAAHW